MEFYKFFIQTFFFGVTKNVYMLLNYLAKIKIF